MVILKPLSIFIPQIVKIGPITGVVIDIPPIHDGGIDGELGR